MPKVIISTRVHPVNPIRIYGAFGIISIPNPVTFGISCTHTVTKWSRLDFSGQRVYVARDGQKHETHARSLQKIIRVSGKRTQIPRGIGGGIIDRPWHMRPFKTEINDKYL